MKVDGLDIYVGEEGVLIEENRAACIMGHVEPTSKNVMIDILGCFLQSDDVPPACDLLLEGIFKWEDEAEATRAAFFLVKPRRRETTSRQTRTKSDSGTMSVTGCTQAHQTLLREKETKICGAEETICSCSTVSKSNAMPEAM